MSVTGPSNTIEEQLVREIRATPEEFWPDLLELVRNFRERATLPSAKESFRRGWREAMVSEGRPISELWDEVEAHPA